LTLLSYLFFFLALLSLVATWKTELVLPLALRIPVFRATLVRADQALWARAVGSFLQAGHTLSEAILACQEVPWSSELRQQLALIPERLAAGDLLSKALSERDLIDPQLRWSVTAGESKEDLSATLFYAAEQLEHRLSDQVQAFFLFLQPLAVAGVGLSTALVLGTFWFAFYHYSWNLTI
ncbi:MAG: type II secretion system F family protein, partial [Vulcanimicrobiota bacterium]